MKILSWNVGGEHRFRKAIQNGGEHDEGDKPYFLEQVRRVDCDIIGFQETHRVPEGERSFVDTMHDELAMNVTDVYAYGDSHIKKGCQLALATASKLPIIENKFIELPNPDLTIKRPNGDVWRTLDVGFLISELNTTNGKIYFLNTHLVPLHYFHRAVMEEVFADLRGEIEKIIMLYKNEPTILVGDFNYTNIREMLPQVFVEGGFRDVFTHEETAPGKGQQDHILVSRHWDVQSHTIERDVEADHYPCVVELHRV